MSCTIFALQLPNPDQASDRLAARLPELQRRRWSELGERRAATYLWSRLFLHEKVLSLPELPVGAWQIQESEERPPIIVAHDNNSYRLSLSLSHSGEWVVAAIVASKLTEQTPLLGIDIERVNPRRSVELARFFCNDVQQHEIDRLDPQQQADAVTRLWSMKEAWFKARQTGILNEHTRRLEFEPASTESGDLACQQFGNDYWLALAGDLRPATEILCYQCDTEALDHPFSQLPNQRCHWAYFRGELGEGSQAFPG